MADMTKTTMATYLPAVWSRLAMIRYRSNVVLPDLMDRRWEPELPVGAGDTVQVPRFTQNGLDTGPFAGSAATARSTFGTGASITFDAVTEAQVSIVVNKMAYKAFRLPVEMSAQTMATYVPLLVNGIGEAIALYVDNQLAADNSDGIDGFTTNVVGTDNIDVTFDNILTCETNMDARNAPRNDRYLVISPATRASLLNIEVFRNSLYASAIGNLDAEKPKPGYMGRILNFAVYQSNNLEAGTSGKKNGAFQQEAIALIMQKEVKTIHTVNLQDGAFDQYFGYSVFGHKMMNETFGNELDGK